jgi:hypothetical protein
MTGNAEHLLRARLSAQRLANEPAPGALAVTRHLLAVQAQDLRAARLAVRARTRNTHASDIDRALTEERSLLVTWCNRGTLHLVAVEDEPWLHALTTPPLRSASARRLGQEGVSPDQAERGTQIIVAALTDRGPLTRAELGQELERAGVPTAGQALVHLLFRATLEGELVRGPIRGGEQAFVLLRDWIGERPATDRDAALRELARRYLAAHSPASESDLARWAGIALRDARRGLSGIGSELVSEADGLLSLRSTGPVSPLPAPRLLGAFEPLLVGWRDRTFVLHEPREVVTVNGIFKPIILIDGRVAGTWSMPRGEVALRLWDPAAPTTEAALQEEIDDIGRFLV